MTTYDRVIDTLQWPPSALEAIEQQRVEIVRLRNELEVSEACNHAKTEALAKIRLALKELSGLNQ